MLLGQHDLTDGERRRRCWGGTRPFRRRMQPTPTATEERCVNGGTEDSAATEECCVEVDPAKGVVDPVRERVDPDPGSLRQAKTVVEKTT